jgi:hypothetical protein
MIIGLLILGCKPTENRLIGTYKKYNDFENWYSLRIKENQEFEFRGQEGIIGIQTQGIWKLKGDTLILNSLENDTPSTINSAKALPTNQLTINVIGADGQPIEGVFVSLISNGITTEKRTEANGRATFPNEKYDSLDVGFLGYQQLLTKLPADGSNDFNIKLMTDYTVFYQLKNQYFKVRWRRLIAESLPSDNTKQILRK